MRIVGAAVLAITLSGSGVVAQERIQALLPRIAVEANPKADRLRKQAEALYVNPRAYRRAALLHEQEAQARGTVDPLQVEALGQSARLYSYVGDAGKGRILMERAAQSALQRGDVARAAHALLDAAFMALKEHDVKQAVALVQQAELLSSSPLLSPDESVAIIRRIDPARVPKPML